MIQESLVLTLTSRRIQSVAIAVVPRACDLTAPECDCANLNALALAISRQEVAQVNRFWVQLALNAQPGKRCIASLGSRRQTDAFWTSCRPSPRCWRDRRLLRPLNAISLMRLLRFNPALRRDCLTLPVIRARRRLILAPRPCYRWKITLARMRVNKLSRRNPEYSASLRSMAPTRGRRA